MSEVDKLFARKNIYTNHNGVSTFNFYLHIRLLAATFKFYFILIKLHFQSPVYFPKFTYHIKGSTTIGTDLEVILDLTDRLPVKYRRSPLRLQSGSSIPEKITGSSFPSTEWPIP